MDDILIQKIDELINIFDNSYEIKKILELKKEIYKDENLKNKLNDFNKIKDDIYNSQYSILKKEILSINSVKEYKKMENELYFLILEINKKLSNLIDKKEHHHENN